VNPFAVGLSNAFVTIGTLAVATTEMLTRFLLRSSPSLIQ
jgi:hypothetical protein